MTYREIKTADRRTELDRATWAGPVQLILSYELSGVGEHVSEMISFGTVYESKPFFSYGVELAPDEILTPGDFPLVSVGIGAWDITDSDDEDKTPFYLGAQVWFNTTTVQVYRYLFRLSFEGVAVRNTEFFRGTNG